MTKTKLSNRIKKSENINFPVTEKQKENLIARADREDLTVAEYIRRVLFPIKNIKIED